MDQWIQPSAFNYGKKNLLTFSFSDNRSNKWLLPLDIPCHGFISCPPLIYYYPQVNMSQRTDIIWIMQKLFLNFLLLHYNDYAQCWKGYLRIRNKLIEKIVICSIDVVCLKGGVNIWVQASPPLKSSLVGRGGAWHRSTHFEEKKSSGALNRLKSSRLFYGMQRCLLAISHSCRLTMR